MNKAITGFVFSLCIPILVLFGPSLAALASIVSTTLSLVLFAILFALLLALYIFGIIFSIQGLKTKQKVFGIIALVLYALLTFIFIPIGAFVAVGVLGGMPGV